jgi:hypothetical protein
MIDKVVSSSENGRKLGTMTVYFSDSRESEKSIQMRGMMQGRTEGCY